MASAGSEVASTLALPVPVPPVPEDLAVASVRTSEGVIADGLADGELSPPATVPPVDCAVGDGSPSDAVPPPHPANITPSTKSPTRNAFTWHLIHKSYYNQETSQTPSISLAPSLFILTRHSGESRNPEGPSNERHPVKAIVLCRHSRGGGNPRPALLGKSTPPNTQPPHPSFPRRREPTARTPRQVHSPEHPTTSPVIPAQSLPRTTIRGGNPRPALLGKSTPPNTQPPHPSFPRRREPTAPALSQVTTQ